MASWFRGLKTWQKWAVSAVAGFVVVSIVGSIFSGDETETGPVDCADDCHSDLSGSSAPSEPPPATAPDATTTTGAPTTTTTEPPTTTTLPPTTTTTTLPPTTTLPLFKVEVSGRGDDVVEVDIPSDDPVIATITYSGRSNFVVWSHTAAAKRLDLLVNVIGAYQGVRPMQLGDGVGGGAVGILEITATGNWEVTIEPLFTARLVLCSEGSAVGEGDDVVVVSDFIDSGGAATLTHNGDRNFSVWAWGTTRDLLVNEIGAYDGTVLVESGLFIWGRLR